MERTIKKETPATEVSTQIVAQETPEVNGFNVQTLISQAISQNIPVETMERLLAMARQVREDNAKEAFNRAMANFQAECPTIVKTKEVKTKSGIVAYKYAPIESIVEQVKPHLQRNGFSYSTNMEVLPAGVKVVCKVTHIEGHTETSEMEVPLGSKTDIMSASQVTAAASTFAKRYAFCNAFGILTGDEDNDAAHTDTAITPKPPVAKSADSPTFPPSQAQLTTIAKLMTQKGYIKEDILDAGFGKLTGGRGGTASELIEFLLKAESKIGPNGQTVLQSHGDIDLASPEVA